MNTIKLSYTVAFLDIESFSLRQNAVIDEVGVLVTNFLPVTDAPWSRSGIEAYASSDDNIYSQCAGEKLVCHSLSLHMEVVEQVLAGRHVDPDTMRFRREQHDKAAKLFPSMVRQHQYEEYANRSRYIVEDAVVELNQFFSGLGKIEEVWMNHPQFDSPRVCNLLGDGIGVPWWTFRAEQDVATMKGEARKLATSLKLPDPYTIPLEAAKPRLEHVGIEDCFYNMWVLMKTQVFYAEIAASLASR